MSTAALPTATPFLHRRADAGRGARGTSLVHAARGPRRTAIAVRRLALLAVIVALGLGLALAVRPAAFAGAGAAPSGSSAHTHSVVVGEGQTLWSIAVQNAGGEDPRDVIVEIRDLNGIEGSVVHPGQRLEVPAR